MISKTNKLLNEFINLHPKYIDLSLSRLEHLLKRLEDENFMRGTPDDADRQLPFDTNEAIAALDVTLIN